MTCHSWSGPLQVCACAGRQEEESQPPGAVRASHLWPVRPDPSHMDSAAGRKGVAGAGAPAPARGRLSPPGCLLIRAAWVPQCAIACQLCILYTALHFCHACFFLTARQQASVRHRQQRRGPSDPQVQTLCSRHQVHEAALEPAAVAMWLGAGHTDLASSCVPLTALHRS